MARNRKKKALYEVIGKGRLKSSYGKTLEQLHPEKSGKDEAIAAESTTQVSAKVGRWPKRPRIVQFNADRIEISMPYPLAIAFLLGVVLLVLVAFRLGQGTKSEQGVTTSDVEGAAKMGEGGSKAANLSAVQARKPAIAAEKPKGKAVQKAKMIAAMPTANNVIVLVQYQVQADLVPVREHFAKYGIETEIVRENDWYFLITKSRYENPEKPGTDGYKAKRRIIEVGAKYKAPKGYETFSPHFFRDAYGKKIR